VPGWGARISLLGGVSIEASGGTRTGLPGRRSELVLAYLVLEHDRVVSREELADALWAEQLPDSWAAALRGVISEVRRALQDVGLDPGALIDRGQGGYRFQLPPEMSVDALELTAVIDEARDALERGDAAAATAAAARAAEVSHRPFLPHHDGEWVDDVRRELNNALIRARELLVRGRRLAGDASGAARAAERLVAADPLNEAAHRLRIEVLGAFGDRGGALRAFEECKRIFADELGVTVSAETEATLRVALEGDAPAQGRSTDPSELAVLVVEDHDFQRRTAVALLRSLGVNAVHEAPDGASALQLLGTIASPDVLVCDIDMPGMDGVQFIRHVAARRLAGSVIIASGLDADVLRAVQAISEGYGLQVLGAVEKPLTARRLGELLSRYRRRERRSVAQVPITIDDVHDALDSGALGTRFRPVIDLVAGSVAGMEVVPFWRHAEHGVVPPSVYVPLLENAGETHRLTELFAGGVAELSRVAATGDRPLAAWVPVLPAELGSHDLADRLIAVLHGGAVSVNLLVKERTLRRRAQSDLDTMTRLRIKGFGIVADEVGRIRSETLHDVEAPITGIRLAAELVGDAAAGRAAALEAAIGAAQDDRLPVMAVACDSPDRFDLLVGIGAQLAQGRLFGPAIPAASVVGYARDWTPPAGGQEQP
jgi:DNA-binding SARP family transcriptional activator/EAL domain-containing protein (putative c-di-GMP-specific phosphodiesterase class I)